MSYHDMYPFDHMADEDFFDDIDDQNYGGGVGDVALDEYEMVCFSFSLSGSSFYFVCFELFYVSIH